MIKMKIIYAVLILILISCKARTSEYNFDNFYGHWAESKEDNVSFTLLNNGIIKYFEDNDLYHYSIEGNKLVIKEEKHIITKYDIMKITSDSLNLKTETGNIIKLYKRKVDGTVEPQ